MRNSARSIGVMMVGHVVVFSWGISLQRGVDSLSL